MCEEARVRRTICEQLDTKDFFIGILNANVIETKSALLFLLEHSSRSCWHMVGRNILIQRPMDGRRE